MATVLRLLLPAPNRSIQQFLFDTYDLVFGGRFRGFELGESRLLRRRKDLGLALWPTPPWIGVNLPAARSLPLYQNGPWKDYELIIAASNR